MKNVILEELNKVKLLMNYNTKVTLSENLKSNSIFDSNIGIITEQPIGKIFSTLFGVADEVALAAIKQAQTPVYKQAVKLLNNSTILANTGFRNVDDLITAMSKGALTKPQVQALTKGLLKKGEVTGKLRVTLVNKAVDMGIKNNNYSNLTGKSIKKDLIKKGYDAGIADDIAVRVTAKNTAKRTKVPVSPKDVDDVIDNLSQVPENAKVGAWSALKKWGIGAGLSIVAIAIIYSLFNDDEIPEINPITDTTTTTTTTQEPRYRDCGEGPFTIGCRTAPEGPIGQVQACLGGLVQDGKFWKKTQAALEDKRYPNGFTKEDIKTICGNQTETEEVTPLPQDDELLDVDSM
jgi:hypothetical protein